MDHRYRYRLQHKEQYVKPNVLGNHNFPVYTYRWVDIAVSGDLDALSAAFAEELKSKDYRIEDTIKAE